MEARRTVYNNRAPHSPYQNHNPINTLVRKKYLINAPRPGMKSDVFRGIDALNELKKATDSSSKRSMVEDVPILLQSRNRRVIKFVPRIVSDSTSSTVSIHDNIGAVQEVRTECNDVVVKPEKEKKPSGVSCSECSLSFYSRMQLCNHVTTAHGIPAPLIHKNFEKEETFQAWLNVIKRTHDITFVHGSGSKNYRGRDQRVTYLQCSRSGDPKAIPHRNVKKPRGSIKCGKTCLAYIKVTQSLRHTHAYGPIKVEGCLSHSGHMIDPEMIELSQEEESAIQQLIERSNRNGPVDITLARAILYPCARFRLITDDKLLQVLPRWMWQIASEDEVREEVGWNGNVLDVEREDEERRQISQSNRIDDTYQGLHHQILVFDETDDFVSVE